MTSFDLSLNLLVTAYLGCVANLNLPILGCVKVKVLRIVCRFAVAEGELRRFTVAEGRCWFLCSGSRQRREWWCLYIFFNRISWNSRTNSLLVLFVHSFPNSYMSNFLTHICVRFSFSRCQGAPGPLSDARIIWTELKAFPLFQLKMKEWLTKLYT